MKVRQILTPAQLAKVPEACRPPMGPPPGPDADDDE
jgi:hypothetical protein